MRNITLYSVYDRNYPYSFKNKFIFIYLGGWMDGQLLVIAYFANFELGGTLFSKIIPNFSRPHSMSIHKLINFLEAHSFF